MTSFSLARIYAGDDGESHFEDIAIPATTAMSPTGVMAKISDLVAVSGLTLREVLEEAPADERHVAPQPLLILQLEGAVEVEASDGEIRRFGPGEPVLVEDTSGKGHITRRLGDGPRRTIVAPLISDVPSQTRDEGSGSGARLSGASE